MTVIGNNIALSLGMVGALSIVSFSNCNKDPEILYIFSGRSLWEYVVELEIIWLLQ